VYCRSCHYDLRGQVIPRCPECNRPFEFDSPDTYIPEFLTVRERGRHIARSTGLQLLRLVLILLMIGNFFAVPRLTHCGSYATPFMYRNLTDIVTEWQLQCGSEVVNCKFDPKLAQANMRPHLSPQSDRVQLSKRLDWEHKISEDVVFVGLAAFFCFLLALTFQARIRIFLVLVAVFSFMGACTAGSYSHELVVRRYPGSYAFLSEFEYLELPTCGDSDPNHTIIAYQSVPPVYLYHTYYIAMASGKVMGATKEMLDDYLVCPPTARLKEDLKKY
jgi:hypothetical protein